MGNYPIEIIGVTPISHFPKFPQHHPCTEFCEIDKIQIPFKKLKNKSIQQVCLKVCIDSFKIICTPAGKKLVINGTKQLKVLFSPHCTHHPHQSIHFIDFDIPFCTFILLKDISDEVVQICSIVEDISLNCSDPRYLTVTSIIFICPVFEKDQPLYPCPPHSTTTCQLELNHCITKLANHNKQQCTYNTSPDYNIQSICKDCHLCPNRWILLQFTITSETILIWKILIAMVNIVKLWKHVKYV